MVQSAAKLSKKLFNGWKFVESLKLVFSNKTITKKSTWKERRTPVKWDQNTIFERSIWNKNFCLVIFLILFILRQRSWCFSSLTGGRNHPSPPLWPHTISLADTRNWTFATLGRANSFNHWANQNTNSFFNIQLSKSAVASSKFATPSPNLPPAQNVGRSTTCNLLPADMAVVSQQKPPCQLVIALKLSKVNAVVGREAEIW